MTEPDNPIVTAGHLPEASSSTVPSGITVSKSSSPYTRSYVHAHVTHSDKPGWSLSSR
jgi:hypothetical protein